MPLMFIGIRELIESFFRMLITNKFFFGSDFQHPVIKALSLMWNKKGSDKLAVVCGGYVAYKAGLTSTFAG